MQLEALQQAVTSFVLSGKAEGLPALLAPRGNPLSRLGIHRNNTVLSLVEAVAANFPVTRALLGERCFVQAARRYVAGHPPHEPRLARYGATFPWFLTRNGICRDVPFVPRVARLEYAILEALDEPVGEPVTLREFVRLRQPDDLEITLQPSLRLLALSFDAAAIWEAHQGNGDLNPALGSRGWHLIQVVRRENGLAVSSVPRRRFIFRRMLMSGRTLGAAAAALNGADELTYELGCLLREGLIVGTAHP
jgi:hypothetical protein